MGTTKDPEGFRRHTAGRGDLLGIKGGGSKRRGCGMAVLLAALAFAARAFLARGERDGSAVAATPSALHDSARPGSLPAPADVAYFAAAASGIEDPLSGPDADSARRAAAASPPTAPPSPARESRGLRPIRLVRGWTDEPLAGVEVHWIALQELYTTVSDGTSVSDDIGRVLRKLGTPARSDAEGRIHLARERCVIAVRVGESSRELEVDGPSESETIVRVFAERELRVDVVDWLGRPAPGIQVALQRIDATGRPGQGFWSGPSSRVHGTLRLSDIDTLLESSASGRSHRLLVGVGPHVPEERPEYESTRLRVALDEALAPDVGAEIDLARDPLPHLRLQLPPLGVVRVLVADLDGRPVPWSGRVNLETDPLSPFPLWQPLLDGRAEFRNLRLRREHFVHAERDDGAAGAVLRLEPLTDERSELEVVLADIAPLPRVRLRPLSPDGSALPRTWITVSFRYSRTVSESRMQELRTRGIRMRLWPSGELVTDEWPSQPTHLAESRQSTVCTNAAGYLDLPLPFDVLEESTCEFVVTLPLDGRTLASDTLRLERGEAWTDLHLGNVPLRAPSPVAEGSK